ncbi:serine protease [Clavibacter sepedonicus]|uniref:serine protease n=1 Tax=Clavibacter sepedonicus TaxID=31964 RepID=UPI001FF0892A|nr:serine protease [Clavibacter sepedonicus]
MLAILVGLVVAVSCLVPDAPAQAVDRWARSQLPVHAGSALVIAGAQSGFAHGTDQDCTAGPVLKGTGLIANLSQYQRAVRFVAIPKHCGGRGPRGVFAGGTEIGSIIWESPDADLAIIRVEPRTTTSPVCHTGSWASGCSLVSHYEQRASGDVFIATNRNGQELALPVTGTKTPSDREFFCISGSKSGARCTWENVARPPLFRVGSHELVAETYRGNLAHGDSGAPVFGRDRKIIGMAIGVGEENEDFATYTAYIPIGYVLAEQPYYAVATD